MSFFDEDDEPTTRVRPRRSASRGDTGAPDRRTLLIRQLTLVAVALLVLLLLVFVVRGCRQSAKETALKNYNRDVAAVVRGSDSQVGQPFFELMRDPTSADLATQVAAFKSQAQADYDRTKKIDTPSQMTAAQRSFLIAMELRRDGLQQVADQIRPALSSDADQADRAIQRISGAFAQLLSSDVIYNQRVYPVIESELRKADVGSQRLQTTRFFPGYQWLNPNTVADALNQQLSADTQQDTGRAPAPGLHGTGIDSVKVGDLTLDAGSPNRITYTADTAFTVNFTNQGENEERGIEVVVRVNGGDKPVRATTRVESLAAGESAAARVTFNSPPPFDSAVDIVIEVKAVPGEKKTDNNKAEFQALFIKG